MEEIIKITEKDGKKAVNARELHQFLGNKREFATWIKQRIEQYGFVENQDFEVFDNFVKNSQGGRPTIEYALSLDMAKELSMVENNEKGRMARKYFIECEKAATKQVSLLDDRLKAAAWAAEFLNMNEVGRLQLAKAVLDPLGLPTPDYVSSKGVMHSASELLKRFGSKLSIVKFNQKLVELGFLKEETRQGTTKLHKFKVITAKGVSYGENQVSPKNQNETQPRWYDDKFEELLKRVGLL